MHARQHYQRSFAKLAPLLIGASIFCLIASHAVGIIRAQTIIQDGDTYTVQGTYPPGFQVEADKSAQVTATVPDTVVPSTPILIAPADGAELTDSTPTFIWTGSSDNVGVTSYVLYLDGSAYISSIPVTATDNGTYTLTYDSGTGQYSLTPKSGIGDGSHTWKIVALDLAGNSASSATWSFRLDTQAPNFIITDIGDETVSISAQDSDTVPTTPVTLSDNEPVLSGTGEANSDVVLQLRLEVDGDVVDDYTFSIDGDGDWTVTLGTLDRGVTYYLTFQITDEMGLLSILEDVPITIEGAVIEIPIPEDFLPIDSPIVIPITVIPLEEITQTIHVVQKNIKEQLDTVTTAIVPESLRATFASSTQSNTRLLSPLWYTHLTVLFLLLIIPLSKFHLLALPFGKNYSLNIGWAIWVAILGYREHSRESLVIRVPEQTALPFMTVRLLPHVEGDVHSHQLHAKVYMSDALGYLPRLAPTEGGYTLHVTIDEQPVEFPGSIPAHLGWEDWYQGRALTFNQAQPAPVLVIPVIGTALDSARTRVKRKILRSRVDSFALLCLALSLLLITPTIGNFIWATLFGGYWLWRNWLSHQTNCHLTSLSTTKLSIPHSIMRLTGGTDQAKDVLAHTDDTGETAIQLKNGSYECKAIHHEYRQKSPVVLQVEPSSELDQVVISTPVVV